VLDCGREINSQVCDSKYRLLQILPFLRQRVNTMFHNGLPDDNRELEPPDPIPNSEVKRLIANGSVRFPHVRVGHRQASN
jgi:hypothetical protein